MPLYMQSGVKVGPYQFDASQPGAELSVGSKSGSRPDAHFIKGGPSGFRYQRYAKAADHAALPAVDVPARPSITQWFDVEMIEVASGDVLQMRNEQFGTILDEINSKLHTSRLATVLPVAMVILAVIAGFARAGRVLPARRAGNTPVARRQAARLVSPRDRVAL